MGTLTVFVNELVGGETARGCFRSGKIWESLQISDANVPIWLQD
jgi:hypothetical protein